jgi:hypothetical protein
MQPHPQMSDLFARIYELWYDYDDATVDGTDGVCVDPCAFEVFLVVLRLTLTLGGRVSHIRVLDNDATIRVGGRVPILIDVSDAESQLAMMVWRQNDDPMAWYKFTERLPREIYGRFAAHVRGVLCAFFCHLRQREKSFTSGSYARDLQGRSYHHRRPLRSGH